MMAGRSVVRWLAIGGLSLVAVAGVAFYLRAYLIDVAATAIAQQSDVPVRSFDVTHVGLNSLTLANIALGEADGPTARQVEMTWTAETLAEGRVQHIRVVEPKIAMTYSDEGFTVDGLASATTGPPGPARFTSLDIESATVSVTTPWGPAAVQGNARIVSGPEGYAPARIDLASGRMDFSGGTLSLADIAFEPTKPLDAVLKVDGVDLEALLALIDVTGLNGSGSLSGAIPIHLDDAGVSITGGKLVATGPGVLAYSGDALPSDIPNVDGQAEDAISLVRRALADFHYSSLALELERATSGEGRLTAKVEGANPQVLDSHPFVLNIGLDANFDTLAEILLDGYATAGQLLRNVSER